MTIVRTITVYNDTKVTLEELLQKEINSIEKAESVICTSLTFIESCYSLCLDESGRWNGKRCPTQKFVALFSKA